MITGRFRATHLSIIAASYAALYFIIGPHLKLEIKAPQATVAVITGATGLIGREIAVGLAEMGMDLVIGCRPHHEARCVDVTSSLWSKRRTNGRKFFVEVVDLASASSINEFVRVVLQRYGSRIRLLVNNAGIINRAKVITQDGMEMMFQVNVWAYFKLMNALLPTLAHNGPSSIVNVASGAAYYGSEHGSLRIDDMEFNTRKYDPWTAYAQSKEADLLLTWKASRITAKVVVNAVHPGILGFCNTTFSSGLAGAYSLFPRDIQDILASSCYDDARSAAARAVWLATKAPQLHLTGSWWVMDEKRHESLRRPKLLDNQTLEEAVWKYCRGIDFTIVDPLYEQASRSADLDCCQHPF